MKTDVNPLMIVSGLYQILFSIAYLQKHFKFTHNDLHINNIMYKKTNQKFLYYKINNNYFRIPTYGILFKIIDFGRAIFTFREKTFFNDVFSKYGEAEGQYTYPIPHIPLYHSKEKDTHIILPNTSFDICRLNTTILDVFDEDVFDEDESLRKLKQNDITKEIISFCEYTLKDKNGESIYNKEESFDLYINIAKRGCNGVPRELLKNNLFKRFRIKKKEFPKKKYYHM